MNLLKALESYQNTQSTFGHQFHPLPEGMTVEMLYHSQDFVAQYILNYIRDCIPDFFPRSLRVLDVGCGIGATSVAFAPHAKEVLGIDLEEKGIRCAQLFAQTHGLSHLQFQTENAVTLEKLQKTHEHSFDLIVCKELAEHLGSMENFSQMMKSLLTVLKPDGVLYLEFPNYRFPFEPHTKMIIPPLASKSVIKWLGRRRGILKKQKDAEYIDDLNIISSIGAEKVFQELPLTFRNVYEEKKLPELFSKHRSLSKRYQFLSGTFSVLKQLRLDQLVIRLIKRIDCYPSVSYLIQHGSSKNNS